MVGLSGFLLVYACIILLTNPILQIPEFPYS